jgi:hypothetical protein
VPQHEKFRVFRGIVAKEHRRQGEQLSGHPVQQGRDHRDMLPADEPSPLSPATMTFRVAQGRCRSGSRVALLALGATPKGVRWAP